MNKTNLQLTGIVIATLAMASGILCLAGCKPISNSEYSKEIQSSSRVIVIDHCQYIVLKSMNYSDRYEGLTHKGNCTNSIHVYNK